MAPQHTVLITAAGGNIGTELVPRLLAAKQKLVLPTSNASRLQAKLSSDADASNVAVEEGSIRDPTWLQTILTKHNVDTVFLCLTVTDELMTTLNFFDAMKRAGCVHHLVYLSACGDFSSPEGVRNVMNSCTAAHVLVKPLMEQKLAFDTSLQWTTTRLGPTLFFSNDVRSKRSMLTEGVFDEPLGEKGVSRVAPSDIALGVVNSVLNPEKFAGKKIMIGSLQRFTGQDITELWSQGTGRTIRMMDLGDDRMQGFEDHYASMVGGGDNGKAWGRDLRLMYEAFFAQGFGMSEEDYMLEVELLGKDPEDYVAWVKETGNSWK